MDIAPSHRLHLSRGKSIDNKKKKLQLEQSLKNLTFPIHHLARFSMPSRLGTTILKWLLTAAGFTYYDSAHITFNLQ